MMTIKKRYGKRSKFYTNHATGLQQRFSRLN